MDSDCLEIPRDFQLLHKSVTLVADLFFVNGIPFFDYAKQENVFVTVKYIWSRTDNQVIISLNKTCSIYACDSYNVEVLLMYMEFETVAAKMRHVTVNT